MGKIVARNASIYLDDSNSACQSFSALTNTISFSRTAEAPDVTSFGSNDRERLADGLKDWELSFNGFFDTAANQTDAVLNGILGEATRVHFGPSGSTSTCVMYAACAVLTDYSMDFGVADAATVSFTVVGRSGSMTRTVWT